MSVQVQQSDQPARYGAVKRWPVHGMNRPQFTADGQRVLYWRNHHSSRLASGRSIGSISVFEYHLTKDEETHPLESLYTGPKKVRFIHPWTSPRYSLDGQVLRFSAQMDYIGGNSKALLPLSMPDMEFRIDTKNLQGRETDRQLEGLGRVYVEHATRGVLAGPGNLRLIDPKTHVNRVVLVQPDIHRVSDADIDLSGVKVTGVIGGRSLKDTGQGPQRTYWLQVQDPTKAVGTINDVPVMPLIDVKSGAVQALQWPNVEALTANTTQR